MWNTFTIYRGSYMNGNHFLLLRNVGNIRVRLQNRHFDVQFIIYIDGPAIEGIQNDGAGLAITEGGPANSTLFLTKNSAE